MTFRGKQWRRDGNSQFLLNSTGGSTGVKVLQWNSGAAANFLVEVFGLGPNDQRCFSIPGKGPAARDAAIETALQKAKEYNRL